MKELTIEEKAKRYDEALERAKKLYEQGTITESLSYVFPELIESEDEKVRKELIKFIKKRSRSGCDYDYDKWIAFLEKHGQTFTKKEVDDAYLAGVRDTKQELEKQGEQKPVNIDIDKMVEDYANDKEYGNEGFGKPANCMIRAYRQGLTDAIIILNLRKQGEQKPAWSEEDEKMVDNILTPLAGKFPWNIYQPMYDWLKTLKQRIGE